MGMFTNLFGRSKETKKSEAAGLLMVGTGETAWSNRDYKSFSLEGYSKNVVAYQSINRIAEAVSSVSWGAWRGDEELIDHPLLELIDSPNPTQSRQEFFQAYVSFLEIAGNSYVEKVMIGAEPKELYVHRPDRMKIKKSASGIPAAYIYKVGQQEHVWEVDQNTMQSPIMHTKMFNPLDDWYGMSPMEAGAFGIDQHNESMNWMHSLLQNSARPSGALVLGADSSLSDDQYARLKSQIENQYSGSGNAGRPMLLDGGLDWRSMGLSPSDMAIIETKYSSARDVSLAFGVPPQLLGIPGDNTYSNYAEARLSFWEDTIIPLIAHIQGDFNSWFAMDFEGVRLVPSLDSVPAIVDKKASLWAMADLSMDLTVNERRELKGYEPIEGGDVLLIDASKIPIDEASIDVSFDGQQNVKKLAEIAGYAKKTS